MPVVNYIWQQLYSDKISVTKRFEIKNLLAFEVLTFLVIQAAAAMDVRQSSDQALRLLVTAVDTTDYGDYEQLLKPLGIKISGNATRSLKPADPGYRRFPAIELTLAAVTEITAAISRTSLNGSQKANGDKRVHFRMSLNTEKLCIQQDKFAEAFGPLQEVVTMYHGPVHWERLLPGPNTRRISAFFSQEGCATAIFLDQNPQ